MLTDANIIRNLEEKLENYFSNEDLMLGIIDSVLPSHLKVRNHRITNVDKNIYLYNGHHYITGGSFPLDGNHVGEEVIRYAILEKVPLDGESFTLLPDLYVNISIDMMTGTDYDSVFEVKFPYNGQLLDGKAFSDTLIEKIVNAYKQYKEE